MLSLPSVVKFLPRPLVLAALLLAICLFPVAAAAATRYFIQISVDGLGSVYLQPMIEQNELPNLKRFQTEGAWTNNARNDPDVTVTLPNHTTMVTARSIKGPGGHRWTSNTDPAKGETLHKHKGYNGPYIASVFQVAHDHGLRTILLAGKTKFSLFRDSYDKEHGAPCAGEKDYGRNKLDCYVYDKDGQSMTRRFSEEMKTQPCQFSFLHYADPDAAGHTHGWGSEGYKQSIRTVDSQLGAIFAMIEGNPKFRGATTIFLTSDHGGKDKDHAKNLLPEVYTIPVYVWGAGAAPGKDLYALNKATRRDPGEGHPLNTDRVQPIRNGDGANLGLKLLGLPAIPGSTINARQDLSIGTARR